jgi:RHS repeat-associated protein
VHGQNGIILGEYQYNELSQLTTKRLHAFNSSWLQTIDYSYNIQGALTSINDPNSLSNSKLWGMRLGYESRDVPWWANDEFGGNITTQTWRANGEPLLHRYFYSYDRMNRLNSTGNGMGAFYINQVPGGGAFSRAHWYHQAIVGYDRNGNMNNFHVYSGDSTANGTILTAPDNFSNAPNQIQLYGNRLWNVQDHGSNAGLPGDFRDNSATPANVAEYGYDLSGSITSDANAGITVEYNHLNMVTKITKPGVGTIEYTYAADGELLARRVNGTVRQEWMGGFVYKQDPNNAANIVLDYIFTPEGRVVRETSGGFVYEYHYEDQVGSLRLAWQAMGNIAQAVEVHNYYPYGVRIPRQHGTPTTAHTYQYRYTGQWNETALGLNYYRFEARLYDPSLGRWTGVDPMAATQGYEYSPYAYCGGNPISNVDPDGRIFWKPILIAAAIGGAFNAVGNINNKTTLISFFTHFVQGAAVTGAMALGAQLPGAIFFKKGAATFGSKFLGGGVTGGLNNVDFDNLDSGSFLDFTAGFVGGGLGAAIGGPKALGLSVGMLTGGALNVGSQALQGELEKGEDIFRAFTGGAMAGYAGWQAGPKAAKYGDFLDKNIWASMAESGISSIADKYADGKSITLGSALGYFGTGAATAGLFHKKGPLGKLYSGLEKEGDKLANDRWAARGGTSSSRPPYLNPMKRGGLYSYKWSENEAILDLEWSFFKDGFFKGWAKGAVKDLMVRRLPKK